jgi:thermitase
MTPSVTSDNAAAQIDPDSPPLPVLTGEYVPDEVLVRFKKSATDESILECFSSSNAVVLSSIEELNAWEAKVPFGKVAESISAISNCPNIRYAEPNYIATIADTIPSDPNWGLQYGLVNIHAPQGWDYSTGSSAVTIAIVDSGVDLSHADLAAKIVPGYDFVNGDNIPQDDYGHGTHVAGIAAAIGNNGLGISGVSWGARIMPIKVLDSGGGGNFANVAAGIIWATDHGAQVLNLSLGGNSPSTVLQDAVNYAYGKGVVLVAAAGNSAPNPILYPASYPNVIAVGAVDSANNHATSSNSGPELDVVAPGVSIYSTVPGGYNYLSGTSMAAPYVAGLAAILRGFPGGYSPDAIEFEMESTAMDLGVAGRDNVYGYGLIQMDRAIQLVYPKPTTVPPLQRTQDNQFFQPGGYGITLTKPSTIATPTSTPTQPPSLTPTNTSTAMPTLTYMPITQAEDGTDVYAQDKKHKFVFSFYFIPCLGIFLILFGLWLFYVAAHKKENKRNNYHNRYRIWG